MCPEKHLQSQSWAWTVITFPFRTVQEYQYPRVAADAVVEEEPVLHLLLPLVGLGLRPGGRMVPSTTSVTMEHIIHIRDVDK